MKNTNEIKYVDWTNFSNTHGRKGVCEVCGSKKGTRVCIYANSEALQCDECSKNSHCELVNDFPPLLPIGSKDWINHLLKAYKLPQ